MAAGEEDKKNKTLGLESGIREGTNKGQTVTGGWERLWADAGLGLWKQGNGQKAVSPSSYSGNPSQDLGFSAGPSGRLGNCTAFLPTL